MSRFQDLLDGGSVIVFDGAMGTLLYERGVPGGSCYDELNLTRPDLVSGIHSEYVAAGADIITTNTFGANPVVLQRYFGLGDRCADINRTGARLARAASGGRLVAGSVGPLTRPAEVYDELDQEAKAEAFRVQVGALLEGGVDLIVFETFNDPAELAIAMDALHGMDGIPCAALLTFLEGGQTLGGLHPLHAGRLFEDLEAEMVGVNCGTGPIDMLKVIRQLASSTGRPLCAMPNAGLARFERGRFTYPHNPEHLGLYARKLVEAGCNAVGGCCGTTPEHVRSIVSSVRDMKPGVRKRVRVAPPHPAEPDEPAPKVETTLSRMLRREFLLSVEVDPPRGPDGSKLVAKLEALKGMGVDAVNVSDGPMARLRMSPAAFSTMIHDRLNLEVIIHATCRDKNILALQSDLLGFSALGLRNVLALSGDPPSIGDYPFATAVYDVRSDGLIRIIDALNRGRDLLGNRMNSGTGFFCGTGVSSAPRDPAADLAALARKAASGVSFVQTQPVFDIEQFGIFFESLRRLGLPVIAGLMPVLSADKLEYLRNEVPGISIPESLVDSLRRASTPEEEAARGLEEARRALETLRRMGVEGVCIMPALHGYDVVEKLLG